MEQKPLRKILIFICFCVMIILGSCEFTPSKEHFVDLDPNPPEWITINLMEQPDTIVVYKGTQFTYRIEANNKQKIYETKFFLNDYSLEGTSDSAGTLYINPINFSSGIYQLSIEVLTSTGTGSLAEYALGEAVYYSKSWVLIIDKSPPDPLEITKIEPQDGRLKIEWENNAKNKISKYSVYRTIYPNEDNSTRVRWLGDINNADQNWFYDNTYIGGEVTYHIDLKPIYGGNVTGISKTYNSNFPKIQSVKKFNGDSILMTWNRCEFDMNFLLYDVVDVTNDKLIISTSAIEDTSLTLNLPFGDKTQIKLFTRSVSSEIIGMENLMDQADNIFAGEIIPNFAYLMHSNVPDIVYLVGSDKIFRYSSIQNQVLNSVSSKMVNDLDKIRLSISPDGKNLVYAEDQKINLLDPVTLSTLYSIDISQYFQETATNFISVSNNGLLSIGKRADFGMDTVACGLYNISIQDTVFTVHGRGVNISTSVDGNYILVSNKGVSKLYKYNTNLEFIADLNTNAIVFNPNDNEQLYCFIDNSIQLLNCSDLSKADQFDISTWKIKYQIDPVSGRIMIIPPPNSNSFKAEIIDFEKKEIIKTKNLYYFGEPFPFYYFFNNELYSIRGYKLSLSK